MTPHNARPRLRLPFEVLRFKSATAEPLVKLTGGDLPVVRLETSCGTPSAHPDMAALDAASRVLLVARLDALYLDRSSHLGLTSVVGRLAGGLPIG